MVIEKLSSELQLQNDGGLSFFFLGVGSAFAKRNFQTNVLFIKGKTHLLIDCGTTCSQAFSACKSSITKVGNFLITHSHADHIGGLEEAALLGRYFGREKPSMIITDGYKRILWNNSLRGGFAFGEYNNTDGYLTFDDYFAQKKPKLLSRKGVPLYHYKLDNLDIKIFRTKHIPDGALTWKTSFYSIGALIDERILFTSDTRFDPVLITWLLERFPTTELVIHDCQFFTGGVHASYDELKTFPDTIRSKMLLSHYGDNFDSYHPKADGFIGFAKQMHYYHLDK